jgi:hypothetical protein
LSSFILIVRGRTDAIKPAKNTDCSAANNAT